MTSASPAGRRPPDGAFAAFRRGLVEPSAPALALALVLGILPFAALAAVVDEGFMASPRGWVFAQGGRDASARVTSLLAQVRRELPAEPQVYVFGASTVRNGVDVPKLESDLREALGGGVRVYGMASGLQRPIEALAMVDALPAGARGVVVVGVGAPSLAYDTEHLRSLVESPRVGIRLDRIDAEARRAGIDVPARSSVYFWDNRRYLLPRIPAVLRNLASPAPDWVAMPQHGRRAPDDKALDTLFRLALGRFRLDETARRESMDVLDRLAAAVRGRGMTLVLLEDTIHPAYRDRPEYAGAVDAMREAVGAFAAERRVPFLHLQERAGIVAGDFADAVHLRSDAAADRFTHELAIEVAPLLRAAAGSGR